MHLPLRTITIRSPALTRADGSASPRPLSVAKYGFRDDVLARYFGAPAAADCEKVVARMRKAEAAYKRAVDAMGSYLKKGELEQVMSPTNSIRDLHVLVADIQRTTTAASNGGFGSFLSALEHYHGIFDVLSQADFSGLPLIWGGLKFLLLVSKNQRTFLSEMVDMVVRVGHSLERIQIYLELYPTPRILHFADELYEALIEFLEEIIKNSRMNSFRRKLSTSCRPFPLIYGDLVRQIQRIQDEILQDATLCHHITSAMTSHSLSRFQRDLGLQTREMEEQLRTNAPAQLFEDLRTTLFDGFELEAGFHEELESTYKVTTSQAWVEWFKEEQKFVPSAYSGKTDLVQALCDAPDPQHALVWKAQQRKFAAHIPSAYLIWMRGMTAQSAIASLLFQIVSQKPEALVKVQVEPSAFASANLSIVALWNLFVKVIEKLGGCMVYISIGSVGEEEFAIVRKFVSMVKGWKGPAIKVTIIHPFHDEFAKTMDVVDLDEKYDVHPSLTTTDAMHHVIMLEVSDDKTVSDPIRKLLWETVWREVRYAVIGIAVTQLLEQIRTAARETCCGTIPEAERPPADTDFAYFTAGVEEWIGNDRCVNVMREQVQRHLDLVDIHIPEDVQRRLSKKLKLIVFSQEGEIRTRPLTQAQRLAIWDDVQGAIAPGTRTMFCSSVRHMLDDVFEDYVRQRPGTEREAKALIVNLMRDRVGSVKMLHGTFSDDEKLIVEGIARSVEIGFGKIVGELVNGEGA